MQNGRDDREMRHFRVIAVRFVKCICLPDASVDGEGFPSVRLLGVVWSGIAPDEILKERVGARRVVRRIRHPKNVFVLSLRKPRRLPELGIAKLLAEQLKEVRAPAFFVLERSPQALYGFGCSRSSLERHVVLYPTTLRRAHSLSFLSRSNPSAHAAPKTVPASCSAWSVINLCARWRTWSVTKVPR